MRRTTKSGPTSLLRIVRHRCRDRWSLGPVQPRGWERMRPMSLQNNRSLPDLDARGRRTSRSSDLRCRNHPSSCFLRALWNQQGQMPLLPIQRASNGTKNRSARTFVEGDCVFFIPFFSLQMGTLSPYCTPTRLSYRVLLAFVEALSLTVWRTRHPNQRSWTQLGEGRSYRLVS